MDKFTRKTSFEHWLSPISTDLPVLSDEMVVIGTTQNRSKNMFRLIVVTVIAEILGNTPDMIYEVYGHVFNKSRLQTVQTFSNVLKSTGGESGGSM